MIYLALFFSFVKVGFTSFGGLSMVPIINQEMLSHGWMTLDEVSDIIAIAEMTPGSLGINCATFVGIRVAGLMGGIIATLGVMVPSFTLCLLAAIFVAKFKGSPYLKGIMRCIRPVCLGLICTTAITLMQENFILISAGTFSIIWPAVIIALICGFLMWKFKLGIPFIVMSAAVLGLILVR